MGFSEIIYPYDSAMWCSTGSYKVKKKLVSHFVISMHRILTIPLALWTSKDTWLLARSQLYGVCILKELLEGVSVPNGATLSSLNICNI